MLIKPRRERELVAIPFHPPGAAGMSTMRPATGMQRVRGCGCAIRSCTEFTFP